MINTLIVAATKLEIKYLIEEAKFVEIEPNYFRSVSFSKTHLFICGIGMMEAALNLEVFLSSHEVEQILHVGIAGSLTPELDMLDVVFVTSETYGDLGSSTHSVFELGLKNDNQFPFVDSKLRASKSFINNLDDLPCVASISVNGMLSSIILSQERGRKFQAEIEHMEGVGVFYVALKREIPLNSVRVISNVAGETDKSNWKIKEACLEMGQFILNHLK